MGIQEDELMTVVANEQTARIKEEIPLEYTFKDKTPKKLEIKKKIIPVCAEKRTPRI